MLHSYYANVVWKCHIKLKCPCPIGSAYYKNYFSIILLAIRPVLQVLHQQRCLWKFSFLPTDLLIIKIFYIHNRFQERTTKFCTAVFCNENVPKTSVNINMYNSIICHRDLNLRTAIDRLQIECSDAFLCSTNWSLCRCIPISLPALRDRVQFASAFIVEVWFPEYHYFD